MKWTYKIYKIVRFGAILTLVAVILIPGLILAESATSTNYQVNNVFFGSGGSLNDCSTTYCAKNSAGEITIGNPSSPNYQARAGFNTSRQPYIEMTVNTVNTNLGTLSSTTTATTTASFTVSTYLAHGYIVVNGSPPPSNNGYFLTNLATPTASQAGVEQFGINLVANTSPISFGSNAVQLPDSSFSFGQAASGYNSANLYKYNQGDTIAFSNQSSGQTTYTISYIFNISNVTPGGTYVFNHVLIATSTF